MFFSVRRYINTDSPYRSPLGEPPAKALVKKTLAVPLFPAVDAIPTPHFFPKPTPMSLSKAAAVVSTNNPMGSVLPVDVVGAAKMAGESGKMSFEDEFAMKVIQQKVSPPRHSPEVTHHLLRPDETVAAFQIAEQARKAAVDVRRQESQAKCVVIERDLQSVDIPQHKIQQLEKITDQLPPSLRTELTISYKGVKSADISQSLETTPTKIIEGTNKLNDYRDTNQSSSSDAVAVSKEPVPSQNGSDSTPSTEKDALKKPSPISVKSVSSINKMSDVEFADKTKPSQVKTSLKFSDETISLEVGHKQKLTQLAEKQSNHSKASSEGADTTVDIRSSKHQSQAGLALPSAKDAQIIDLSSDEERPMRPRVAPVAAAPVPVPAQFSPPPSTALTVTPVGRDPSPALRESVPTSRETLSASPESLSYFRDFSPTIKKPVPTAAEMAPSLKKPVPTAGELAPAIRKPVPIGGELSTPIKKPIPTVGELALATKSPSSPGFNDSSNSKLEEEMDDVMNELLQISKKKQQSSPPVPSGSDASKTSSVPSSQQREKQHRISSSALMAGKEQISVPRTICCEHYFYIKSNE